MARIQPGAEADGRGSQRQVAVRAVFEVVLGADLVGVDRRGQGRGGGRVQRHTARGHVGDGEVDVAVCSANRGVVGRHGLRDRRSHDGNDQRGW